MKRVFALLVTTVLLLTLPALAQSASPSADAFTNQAIPHQNYSNAVTLLVEPGSSNAFIRFDLSLLPPQPGHQQGNAAPLRQRVHHVGRL